MKVIIDIRNPLSQYHKYNGLTFDTKDILHNSVGVLLKDGNFNQTDFSFNELIIVDFQGEVKRCVKFSFYLKLKKLKTYAKVRKIDIDKLISEYSKD